MLAGDEVEVEIYGVLFVGPFKYKKALILLKLTFIILQWYYNFCAIYVMLVLYRLFSSFSQLLYISYSKFHNYAV